MSRLAFLLLLLACAGPAFAQDVVVRSKLEPESGAVIGQHIRLMIDVLFKGDMPRPPRVSIGEAPGAQILRIETQATSMTDRIDGESYGGQRFEFALYARRGGTIAVPAARVTLLDHAGEETGHATGQPLKVEIAIPRGVDPSLPVIASSAVTLEQQWSPDPRGTFAVGDAIVRTVTRSADDVPAMAMRDLVAAAPDGVRVYADPPDAQDRQDRGALVGRRVDRITYVFERAGQFRLPAVAQPWWNLVEHALNTAQAAGLTISVAAPVEPTNWRRLSAIGSLAALVVIGFLWWSIPRLRALHRQWLQSEAKAFRDLRVACRRGDLRTTYRTFTAWRRHCRPSPLLLPLAEELESALFGAVPATAWSPVEANAFIGRASEARHRIDHTVGHARAPALPPLNPATDDPIAESVS